MRREYLNVKDISRWAQFNGIDIDGVRFDHIEGSDLDVGLAVKLDTTNLDRLKPLLRIPAQLILNHAYIHEQSKMDKYLREVLVVNRPLSFSARGATMIFLLMKMTNAVGTKCPWNEYVKFLPYSVPLPTNWTLEERELLVGTSLEVAVTAKLSSLENEFESFKTATEDIPWCEKVWWCEEDGLSLSDWVRLDAIYRSRVLEIPNLGPSMVPCLDFCNHNSKQNSIYEVNEVDGDISLRLLDDSLGATDHNNVEVTIDYGTGKGAAEMAFAYGFISSEQESAISLRLDVRDMTCKSTESPLYTVAKQRLMKSPPTLTLNDSNGAPEWASDYVWLISVNEEDGLEIKVLQETDGTQSLQAVFDDFVLVDVSALQHLLEEKPLYPVFQLRAAMLAEEKLEAQLQRLLDAGARLHELKGIAGDHALQVCKRLRALEANLFRNTLSALEKQKQELLASSVVTEYLTSMQEESPSLGASDGDEEADLT